jgi:hypothetical protein
LEVHALIGITRLNRMGVTQPTQDEDPQAMSNPLEYILALHLEMSRTTHNHQDRSQR